MKLKYIKMICGFKLKERSINIILKCLFVVMSRVLFFVRIEFEIRWINVNCRVKDSM